MRKEDNKYSGVPKTLIAQILNLIEESGISFAEAAMVPAFLEVEIKMYTHAANQKHRFTISE